MRPPRAGIGAPTAATTSTAPGYTAVAASEQRPGVLDSVRQAVGLGPSHPEAQRAHAGGAGAVPVAGGASGGAGILGAVKQAAGLGPHAHAAEAAAAPRQPGVVGKVKEAVGLAPAGYSAEEGGTAGGRVWGRQAGWERCQELLGAWVHCGLLLTPRLLQLALECSLRHPAWKAGACFKPLPLPPLCRHHCRRHHRHRRRHLPEDQGERGARPDALSSSPGSAAVLDVAVRLGLRPPWKA
jgi:hypothetical protein